MSRIWLGSIGRNDRNVEATAALNMFPKFDDVPMSTYLMVFANVRRPSLTPSASTPRSFSSRTMSAASLATSVGGFDRDPDVGGVERDGVVDAVAEERDVAIGGAMRADQASLLLGTHAGEDRRVDDTVAECVVVERGDLGTGHGALDVEAEVATDLLGDDGVVAGDDLDGDAELGEALRAMPAASSLG